MHILIVDDTKEVLDMLEKFLTSRDHTVVRAIDGNDGLWNFTNSEKKIDMVITDLNMPIFHGNELASRIRSANKEVTIVLHTASIVYHVDPAVNYAIDKFDFARLKTILDQPNDWRMDRSCDI